MLTGDDTGLCRRNIALCNCDTCIRECATLERAAKQLFFQRLMREVGGYVSFPTYTQEPHALFEFAKDIVTVIRRPV